MEKLYNNILLPDDFAASRSDAQNVPYLKNPPPVIDVSVGRQLFVDDFLTDATTLAPVYHKAVKHPDNPVFKPETPWECEGAPVACPKSGGVWYDKEENLYKMWYEAGWLRRMCYATSRDGLCWERPDLGIVPGTNIILPYEGYAPETYYKGYPYLRPDSTTVFIDYEAPKSEKYKLFLRNPGGKSPAFVAVSGDGIHFGRFTQTSDVFDRSTMFYNPFRRKWVYSIRAVGGSFEDNTWYRKRDYRETDDLLAGAVWTEDEAHDWMACDELDKPNPYIGYVPQLYNVDCVAYESLMLGMFQISYGPDNLVCEAAGVPKITELMPMYSRDGYHFSRPCRDTFIGASIARGTWDRGYVQSVGGVMIVKDDELWIYYIGFGGDESHAGRSPVDDNGIYCNGATGLAVLRRDGFVSMEGDGTLTTRPLTCTGKSGFFINACGEVSVEILDETGGVLARSLVFRGDSTKAVLAFDGFDVSSLNGKVFRLRFAVKGALYAFALI